MDPHPTPFPGKRRSVATPATTAARVALPKPKSIAVARATRMAKRSPTGNTNAAPQPRLTRRAFGTVRSVNAPVEKSAPAQPSKVSPPPPQKPAKVSPPPPQKPAKVSPPPWQKPSMLLLSAVQKPSKLSPPHPAKTVKPSRPAARPLKKTVPAADLEAKAKKRSQRVSFQVAAVEATALGSRLKVKASADDVAGHTPMVAMRAAKKPAKVVAAETPFFSAQNCSDCTIDQLESATYWLGQIRLAEAVGKHCVAATFFRLAFECQAQPIHRIQSELRNYTVRHESASTLTPLFDGLLSAHGMPVNQPTFDTDGFEKADTPLATNVVHKLDSSTLKVDECLPFDSGDDLIDVSAVIVDQPSFERKLDESFEFDDSEAVLVDGLEEANLDLQNSVDIKVRFSSDIVQSACGSPFGKLSPEGTAVVKDSSSVCLSSDNSLDQLFPSIRSSPAKSLSSGSPFDMKSPLSSKRLTSSCPSYKKSAANRDLPAKQMPSGSCSDGVHNAGAGSAEPQNKMAQDMGSESPVLVDYFESNGPVEDGTNNEIH